MAGGGAPPGPHHINLIADLLVNQIQKCAVQIATDGTAANNKRLAYLNGAAARWWLRSPSTYNSNYAWVVNSGGNSYVVLVLLPW